MKSIRILGGGIAGLTAAINLKKAGKMPKSRRRRGHGSLDRLRRIKRGFEAGSNYLLTEGSVMCL